MVQWRMVCHRTGGLGYWERTVGEGLKEERGDICTEKHAHM